MQASNSRSRLACAKRIRTYSVDRGLDQVPQVAREFGLKVSLRLWLSDDRVANEREIERGIEIIRKHANAIDRVFVGNEVILRGELTAAEVAEYIERVRQGIRTRRIEVGTADVWNKWREFPVLAKASERHKRPFESRHAGVGDRETS